MKAPRIPFPVPVGRRVPMLAGRAAKAAPPGRARTAAVVTRAALLASAVAMLPGPGSVHATARGAASRVAASRPDGSQPSPNASESIAVNQLALHIPTNVIQEEVCNSAVRRSDGMVAVIQCQGSADQIPNYVRFIQFTDRESMDRWAASMTHGVRFHDAACDSPANLDAKVRYTSYGELPGILYCYRLHQGVSFLWTDNRVDIAAIAIEVHKSHYQAFVQWWRYAALR